MLRKRWRRGDQFLVRHKDRSILVVEKKAGLLTVPTPAGRGADLVSLLSNFAGTKQKSIFAVHRLDRPVSGLLVFARNPTASKKLIEQFKLHTVERVYMAAVSGSVPDDNGTFESYLTTEPSRVRSDEGTDGKRAVTHWTVIERIADGDATMVEVRLETGLRNQIRVHFAEAGFPLLGERKYLDADDPGSASTQGTQRIFLHAAILGFEHPRTDEKVRFEAPLPPDLVAWQGRLKRRAGA